MEILILSLPYRKQIKLLNDNLNISQYIYIFNNFLSLHTLYTLDSRTYLHTWPFT